jgi:RimJ/RimL family protein N-acetyltransferase
MIKAPLFFKTQAETDFQFRKLKADDIDDLSKWFKTITDKVLWAGASFLRPSVKSEIKRLMKSGDAKGWKREFWAMTDRDTKALIGTFQLAIFSPAQQATLGRVAIKPDRRGQGLAHPLVAFAVERAFSRKPVHRLELNVYDFNKQAIATYQRNGFQIEGLRRDAIHMNNIPWNSLVMSQLRSEYESQKPSHKGTCK